MAIRHPYLGVLKGIEVGKGKEKITEIVKDELTGFLGKSGLSLYHVDFKKEGKDWYLNVYIDIAEDASEGDEERYVSTDDCEKVSEYLGARLDELDPIEQNYMLCVSSPGLDRELYEQKDFDRFTGSLVDIKLFRPLDGKKEFCGTLLGLEDGVIKIEEESGDVRGFDRKDVAKASLSVVF